LKTIQEAAGYGGNLDDEDQEYNFRRNDSEFTLGDKEGIKNVDEEKERKVYAGQNLSYENFEEKREKNQKNEEFEERREVWKITPEKIESVIENVNKRRMSPKLSRPALPKSLLSDPEISRIAAIMKGNK
jgi:predicted metal-dependent peptidase